MRAVSYGSNIVHLVFYFVIISEKKWRYAFQTAKEVLVCHTIQLQSKVKKVKLGYIIVRSKA